MVVTINLKFKQLTSRVDESDNGDSVSIKRSRTDYHSHNTNLFQTKFFKLNFPNFEVGNPNGWIYKCDRFLKLIELRIMRRQIGFLTFKRKSLWMDSGYEEASNKEIN